MWYYSNAHNGNYKCQTPGNQRNEMEKILKEMIGAGTFVQETLR